MSAIAENQPTSPTQPTASPNESSVAGFWQRVGAATIDTFLLAVLGGVVGLVFREKLMELGPQTRWLGLIPMLGYFGIMNSNLTGGQTLGKRILKIKLVDQNARPIAVPNSFFRASLLSAPVIANGAILNIETGAEIIGAVLAAIVFWIGPANIYLFLFNRNTRQGFHDLLARTYVVKAESSVTLPGSSITENAHRKNWIAIALHAVIFVAAISAFGMWINSKVPDWADVKGLQAELLTNEDVAHAAVLVNTDHPHSGDNSFVNITLFASHDIEDLQGWAKQMAVQIAGSHEWVRQKSRISVNAVSQYDLGIWRVSTSRNGSWKPGELVPEGQK